MTLETGAPIGDDPVEVRQRAADRPQGQPVHGAALKRSGRRS